MTNPMAETGEKGIPVIGSSTDRTSEMQILFAGDVMPEIDWHAVVKATIEKAVLEEREACAEKIARAVHDRYYGVAFLQEFDTDATHSAAAIADFIRSIDLSKTEGQQ